MRFSLARWRAGHLVAAWSGYWLGLAAFTLTPIALAIYRATRAGAGPGQADVSVSLGDKGIGITVTRLGQTVLDRSAGVLPIALWIAVPPLLLWGGWVYARSRAIARGEPVPLTGDSERDRLDGPAPDLGARQRDRAPVRRDPEP